MGLRKIRVLRGRILDISYVFRQRYFEAEAVCARPTITGQI